MAKLNLKPLEVTIPENLPPGTTAQLEEAPEAPALWTEALATLFESKQTLSGMSQTQQKQPNPASEDREKRSYEILEKCFKATAECVSTTMKETSAEYTDDDNDIDNIEYEQCGQTYREQCESWIAITTKYIEATTLLAQVSGNLSRGEQPATRGLRQFLEGALTDLIPLLSRDILLYKESVTIKRGTITGLTWEEATSLWNKKAEALRNEINQFSQSVLERLRQYIPQETVKEPATGQPLPEGAATSGVAYPRVAVSSQTPVPPPDISSASASSGTSHVAETAAATASSCLESLSLSTALPSGQVSDPYVPSAENVPSAPSPR